MSISDSIRYKRIDEFYNKHGGASCNLVKLGYPGLDNAIANYDKFSSNKKNIKSDLIIFLSLPYSPFIEMISKYIEISLNNGYRVIYKTHGGHLELLDKEREIVKKWKDYKNFEVLEGALSDEILFESLCIVEFRSSMLYTYPLITKKPALYLQPDFEVYKEEDNFYCRHLHIKINNIEEFLRTLENLKEDKFMKQRKELIEEYCKQYAYNLGNASYATACFIEEFLQDCI